MTSILTGLYPQRHGSNGERDRLSAEVGTLPELLQQADYATAAVITNGVVSTQFGFDRGFDVFRYLGERPDTARIHQGADVLHTEALAWLASRDRERPFFLYLHATDPHAPYRPPERWRKRFAPTVEPELGDHAGVSELEWNPKARSETIAEDLRALYDAEIAFVDAEFGRLLSALRDAGDFDDTLIVVVSDHGEEFGEHGRWQHGLTLNEEQLRVPLLLKLPGGLSAGTRIGRPVEQVDIAPTVLAAAGVENGRAAMQGRDLLPWLQSAEAYLARASPSGDVRPSVALLARRPEQRRVESIVVGDRKLIRYRAYDRPRPRMELFDLLADPAETTDLAAEHAIEASFLLTRLRLVRTLSKAADTDSAEIDAELEKSLRAVGYLD